MRRPVLLAAVLLLSGASPAAAAGTSPREVGVAVAREVVHVAPGAEGILSARDAAAVRARIARRDPGRIRVAAVPPAAARAAGSLQRYANAASEAAVRPGTLLVIDGGDAWLVTSWDDVDAAQQAVQRAIAPRRGGNRGFLLRAVDELAAADPGEPPQATPPARAPVAPPRDAEAIDEGDGSGDLTGTLKLVGLIVGIAVALPFLLGALLLVRSAARRRGREREDLTLRWEEAQRRLGALADAIADLDGSVPDPGSPAARLLDGYERAESLLEGEPSTRALTPAERALGEAEWALARTAAPPALS